MTAWSHRRLTAICALFGASVLLAALSGHSLLADDGRKGPARALNSESPLQDIRSGYSFMASALKRIEDDTAQNPGMVWYHHGRRLWRATPLDGRLSCAHCHNAADVSMRGVAPRYPRYDRASKRLVTLEQRINLCRTRFMGTTALKAESDDLLALSIYVRRQSLGMAISPRVGGYATADFARGRTYFQTRRGQRNLACTACHEHSVGKVLRNTRLSQALPNAFPAYRPSWGRPGSLHRRFRACNRLARAVPRPIGDPEYVALELYLGWRGAGARVETPGVRP